MRFFETYSALSGDRAQRNDHDIDELGAGLQQDPWIGQRRKMLDDRSGHSRFHTVPSLARTQFNKVPSHTSTPIASTITYNRPVVLMILFYSKPVSRVR